MLFTPRLFPNLQEDTRPKIFRSMIFLTIYIPFQFQHITAKQSLFTNVHYFKLLIHKNQLIVLFSKYKNPKKV